MTWGRRTFLQGTGALLALPACGVDVESSAIVQPPWHMWGGTTELFSEAAAINPLIVGNQLAKVSYRRPDTWCFFFGAEIIGGEANSGGNTLVTVDIDIMLGLGRTVFSTQNDLQNGGRGFVRFKWQVGSAALPADELPKWATVGRPQPTDDTDVAATQTETDKIVAQDIQCAARLTVVAGTAASAKVAITAFFAPMTHIRPDWFAVDARQMFLGNETGGT